MDKIQEWGATALSERSDVLPAVFLTFWLSVPHSQATYKYNQ